MTENATSLLKLMSVMCDIKEFFGKREWDGCSSFCCFAQPFVVCCEEKTLFVIDRATLTVQIITSLKPLINYLMIFQSVSKASGIHHKHLETLRDATRTLETEYFTLERMVQDARSRLNKPTLKPEGPEGTPSFVTVDQLRMSRKNLKHLIILETINPDFVSRFDLSCLLTLVCEHHFSVARAKYPMPTPYQYLTDAISIMKESMKKKTDYGYLYYTHSRSFYPVPEGSLKFEELRFPKKKVSSQIPKKMKEILWRNCAVEI